MHESKVDMNSVFLISLLWSGNSGKNVHGCSQRLSLSIQVFKYPALSMIYHESVEEDFINYLICSFYNFQLRTCCVPGTTVGWQFRTEQERQKLFLLRTQGLA